MRGYQATALLSHAPIERCTTKSSMRRVRECLEVKVLMVGKAQEAMSWRALVTLASGLARLSLDVVLTIFQ
jgi:hypothetical protein